MHIFLITLYEVELIALYFSLEASFSLNRQLLRGLVPQTSPSALFFSNSSFVLSSKARISAIVMPCHLSVQQNTCLWKFVNNLFSVCRMNDSTLVWRPNHLNSHVTSYKCRSSDWFENYEYRLLFGMVLRQFFIPYNMS